MISTVFLVHHGSNLQSFQSLNISSVIMAAEVSLTTFFQHVEAYIQGTIGLVTNLPAELAGLPQNVRTPPFYTLPYTLSINRCGLPLVSHPCCIIKPSCVLLMQHCCDWTLFLMHYCNYQPGWGPPETRWSLGIFSGTFTGGQLWHEEVMRCVQISDAAALSNQPDLTQLGNSTYLMEAFEKLVADLEDPIAVAGSGAVFSYSPCFVNVAPAGVHIPHL